MFALTKYVFAGQVARLNKDWVATVTVAGPVLVAFTVFALTGLVRPWRDPASDELVAALSPDADQAPGQAIVHA